MGLIRTELMPDSSEVVPYDHAGIPLYIRAAHLASYYNMCAPCHWHDDVEILTVAKGTLQIMVDGRELRGEEGDIFFFNSGQIHQIQGNGFENDYYSFVFSMKSLDFRENDYTQTTILNPIGDQRWFPQILLSGEIESGCGGEGSCGVTGWEGKIIRFWDQ